MRTSVGNCVTPNRHHFFEPNAIKHYSVGTKNKDLRKVDGSLTLYVQADEPKDPVERANWLPSPRTADFSLYVRANWPEDAITRGQWTPPGNEGPVKKSALRIGGAT
jgi:hypothetical protein